MTTGPLSSAASSCAIDQSAHRGSSVTRSNRTLVSISVMRGPGWTSSVAAGERHDLVGAESRPGAAPQTHEPAGRPFPVALDEDHAAVRLEFKLDRVALPDRQPIADRLGDSDL